MRKRNLATTAVLAMATVSVVPIAAHADSSTTTIYVGSFNKSCTDSGTGTQAAPFCSLQAGVDAAAPGDTVLAASGIYAPVTFTHSGTAAQPITVEGNRDAEIVGSKTATAPAFTFTDVSYLTVTDFSLNYPTAAYASIVGSSHITVDRLLGETYQGAPDNSLPGFEITGSSSDVTLSRNQTDDRYRVAPSVQVDAGSSGDVITTNGIENGMIAVNGAPGTDVTSNTVVYPDLVRLNMAAGIELTGASSNSFVENNVVIPYPVGNPPSSPTGVISVGPDATVGTTVDYNVIDMSQPDGNGLYQDYLWGDHIYPTPATFTAATGQGAHDLIGNPDVGTLAGGFGVFANPSDSTILNNANSAAPGELSTDINADPRVPDPLYPQTGAGPYAYYDRGAGQILPATSAAGVTTTADGALGVSATSQHWSSTGYTIDFGDDSGATTAPYGTGVHTYAKPGTYTITVSGTDSTTGTPFADPTTFTTTAQPAGILYQDQRLADGAWSGNGWQSPAGSNGIANIAVTGLPDGSTQYVAVTSTGQLEHNINYADGTWQGWRPLTQSGVTLTGASVAGMSNGSTQIIEVTNTGVLKHDVRNANGSWQAGGWGSPAGSTNIAQAAITALPDGSVQLVAVTTSGVLEHNICYANGTWQGWRALSQPGVTVTGASVAGMSNGSTQIIEVTSTGVLKHDVRNANGSWQAGGWGSPAGSTNIAQAAITALPDGSVQLVAVTTSGVLEHNIRYANGTWQKNGWGTPTPTDLVASVAQADIASLPDGTTDITEISAN